MSEENKPEEKPVSRFWACFFSTSIFALLWTQKMEKTRKWILIMIITSLGSIFVVIVSETMEGLLLFITIFIPTIIFMFLPIYLMFRWTTEYNLKKFGFKSRKEWVRSKNKSQTDFDQY